MILVFSIRLSAPHPPPRPRSPCSTSTDFASAASGAMSAVASFLSRLPAAIYGESGCLPSCRRDTYQVRKVGICFQLWSDCTVYVCTSSGTSTSSPRSMFHGAIFFLGGGCVVHEADHDDNLRRSTAHSSRKGLSPPQTGAASKGWLVHGLGTHTHTHVQYVPSQPTLLPLEPTTTPL